MRESDEDEVRRFYRDMLAGIRRIADMLERMADFKSVITESVDGWGQDGDSEGEKTGSGMDWVEEDGMEKFARKSQMIIIQSPPISTLESEWAISQSGSSRGSTSMVSGKTLLHWSMKLS